MFRRVLIANRGEIAVRIIRTLREMGIKSIAVFSDADRDALFVSAADEAYRLGASPAPQSYLSIEAVLAAARESRVEAIHPGYGFLAENADFASAVAEAGLTFIGPSTEAMRIMGDKVRAREAVRPLGVPLVPGTDGPVVSLEASVEFGRRVGYPIAVKASGGGGGRGIRVVREPSEMGDALEGARREAAAYFKNPEVYLERYFENPRHVEIQVLGDSRGKLVSLGERDCSVQRRHQKLIEESPSPAVNRELRARMSEAAVNAAESAGYSSAGTVEFLVTESGEFYFLEMNTRIQVEHPVTEMVTGHDLIREMILIAAGEPMSVAENVLDLHGHAMEVRVNAEDPATDFRPTPGEIARYREPAGIGTRVDSGVMQGSVISPDYDSLLSKVIAWAPDREQARLRMLRAIGEYEIAGPATTLPFAHAVLNHSIFVSGQVTTPFVTRHLETLLSALPTQGAGPVGAAVEVRRGDQRMFEVEVNRRLFRVHVSEVQAERNPRVRIPRQKAAARSTGNDLISPMHGTVISIKGSIGDLVHEGQPLFILEAMKMENEVAAQKGGTLTLIEVQAGDTVEQDQRLAVIE